VSADCLTCRANRGEVPTPGGVIYEDGLWRLEHTVEPIPMVGWLVLKPLRHVENVAELTPEEAAAFGTLVRRASAALTAVLGCAKVYVCVFAESATAQHVHAHLIPRAADLPRERRGPGVFGYLREATTGGENLADAAEAARVAAEVRNRLRAGAGAGPGETR
jgi:diadenosine tetraphosphate (Ap4A) HIT family hydrolase